VLPSLITVSIVKYVASPKKIPLPAIGADDIFNLANLTTGLEMFLMLGAMIIPTIYLYRTFIKLWN
jgi:hypothetical protein